MTEAVEALDQDEWQVAVAKERRRAVAGTGVDAVVQAVRRGASGPAVDQHR